MNFFYQLMIWLYEENFSLFVISCLKTLLLVFCIFEIVPGSSRNPKGIGNIKWSSRVLLNL